MFGFFWNWKYYTAYKDVNNGFSKMQVNDYDAASNNFAAAYRIVPEVKDLKQLENYAHGIKYLLADKNEEAIALFKEVQSKMGDFADVNQLMLKAETGASFNRKDYNAFLDNCKNELILDTTVASNWAAVASAYSCLYATTGADSLRQLANRYIQKASALDSTTNEAKFYDNMIAYRLDKKEVITREAFAKAFPNGWTKTN